MEDKLTDPLKQQPAKKKSSRMAWVFLILAIALGAGYMWHSSRNTQAAGQNAGGPGGPGGGGGGGRFVGGGGPVPVVVAVAQRQDLPVYLDGLGSVTAFNTVTIKSRVDGQLVQVDFQEGQEVHKGDDLAVIDPRPYQAVLDQAMANLQRDTSQINDAKANDDRYRQLVTQGVIPQQQADTQHALVGQLSGAVASDQAQIDNAKLNLAYSHIKSPIDGRVGLRLVDVGNIVHASDPGGLLVITQMEPIAVIFTLSEDSLPAVNREMSGGTLPVKAFSRDNGTEIATGKLLTIDNQIDPTTGTYKLKAVFDNKNRALWPNQFVNARLLLNTEKNAIVVPAAAIQRGAQGTFVYRVKQNNQVEAAPVVIDIAQGNVTSIRSGLSAGDQVVTDGQDRLRAGMAVEPHSSDQQAQSLASTAAAGQAGGRRGQGAFGGGQGGPGGPNGQGGPVGQGGPNGGYGQGQNGGGPNGYQGRQQGQGRPGDSSNGQNAKPQ